MDQPLPRPESAEPSPDQPPWKAVLSGKSSREILARIVDGDPLELRARCELRLRSQALLLDGHRLQLRSAAHAARHAPGYVGLPPIDVWLNERIRKSVQELLRDDAELVAAGVSPEAPDDDRLLIIANTFGIDPNLIGRGCSAFNRIGFEARAAFHALVLEAQDPAAWCRENSTTTARALAALRSAMRALGARRQIDLDELLGGGDDDA